jgi:hypothetical protein
LWWRLAAEVGLMLGLELVPVVLELVQHFVLLLEQLMLLL